MWRHVVTSQKYVSTTPLATRDLTLVCGSIFHQAPPSYPRQTYQALNKRRPSILNPALYHGQDTEDEVSLADHHGHYYTHGLLADPSDDCTDALQHRKFIQQDLVKIGSLWSLVILSVLRPCLCISRYLFWSGLASSSFLIPVPLSFPHHLLLWALTCTVSLDLSDSDYLSHHTALRIDSDLQPQACHRIFFISASFSQRSIAKPSISSP